MAKGQQSKQQARIVVGYCRVSTDKQAEHGQSLEAQQAKLKAMAVVQGAELAEVIVDGGESAGSLHRPGMERLLHLVDTGLVRTVIISKLDRLTRSVRDLAELLERFERRGVSLVSVAESLDTHSAAGRLVLNIMACVSQWERETIGERTRDVLRHKRTTRQVYCPNVPFGFDRQDGRLVPNPAEQGVIQDMQTQRQDGWSLRRIAEYLNAQGITTKQGRKWFAMTVKDVLDNPLHSASAIAA